jgi:hypothetical protein
MLFNIMLIIGQLKVLLIRHIGHLLKIFFEALQDSISDNSKKS